MRCQANRRRKRKGLDDRIAEHRTRMARGNSREEGTGAGRYTMLASMRAKGKAAFDAGAINKVTMNKRHMDMPSRDAIIGRHEMPS